MAWGEEQGRRAWQATERRQDGQDRVRLQQTARPGTQSRPHETQQGAGASLRGGAQSTGLAGCPCSSGIPGRAQPGNPPVPPAQTHQRKRHGQAPVPLHFQSGGCERGRCPSHHRNASPSKRRPKQTPQENTTPSFQQGPPAAWTWEDTLHRRRSLHGLCVLLTVVCPPSHTHACAHTHTAWSQHRHRAPESTPRHSSPAWTPGAALALSDPHTRPSRLTHDTGLPVSGRKGCCLRKPDEGKEVSVRQVSQVPGTVESTLGGGANRRPPAAPRSPVKGRESWRGPGFWVAEQG